MGGCIDGRRRRPQYAFNVPTFARNSHTLAHTGGGPGGGDGDLLC